MMANIGVRTEFVEAVLGSFLDFISDTAELSKPKL
jgi:hypothetical protein